MANDPNLKKMQLPFYAKTALIFIGLYVFINILYIGQSIIVPVLYATLIAIMLSHMVSFLVRKKVNRILAIVITMVLTVAIVVSLVVALFSQSVRFSEAIPILIDKLVFIVNQLVIWISQRFNVSTSDINLWLGKTQQELLNKSSAWIGTTLATVSDILVVIFLIPVYIFMLLYYQPLLIEFVHKLFGTENNSEVTEVLGQTKSIIQSYLTGLIIEGAIVAVLNSIGLLILGIEYAVILGIMGAFLNVIPYLGGIIGVIIYMVIALITKPPAYSLYVLILYFVIQLIDNNFIVPKIVGSKVKINAFISIIAVIAGGALWGIPGMFLSIPLIAILKLIFERIDGLKPWGFLLGDTMPAIVKLKFPFKKKVKK